MTSTVFNSEEAILQDLIGGLVDELRKRARNKQPITQAELQELFDHLKEDCARILADKKRDIDAWRKRLNDRRQSCDASVPAQHIINAINRKRGKT
jgi:hypothetical protein